MIETELEKAFKRLRPKAFTSSEIEVRRAAAEQAVGRSFARSGFGVETARAELRYITTIDALKEAVRVYNAAQQAYDAAGAALGRSEYHFRTLREAKTALDTLIAEEDADE